MIMIMWYTKKILILTGLLCVQAGTIKNTVINNTNDKQNICHLPINIIEEIDSYKPIVEKIIHEIFNGSFKGRTYIDLARFTDEYHPRVTGTETLNMACQHVIDESFADNLQIHKYILIVPSWARGKESATLLHPLHKDLPIFGLVGSVGTPENGMVAHVLAVDSIEDFIYNQMNAAGRIVVFNQEFTTYEEAMENIIILARKVESSSGRALLVRSVTPFSLYTPHTEFIRFESPFKNIPVAFITAEDAFLLRRMYIRKPNNTTIKLKMDSRLLNVTGSQVAIALNGSSMRDKIVLLSEHIDTLDVGEGVMNDGGGIFVGWTAMKVLKHLDLQARRTIRMVLYTGSQIGHIGSNEYNWRRASEHRDLQFVMESGYGIFQPKGFAVTGTNVTRCILQKIMGLIGSVLGTDLVVTSPCKEVSDMQIWLYLGVPGGCLVTSNEKYYSYYHSKADNLLQVNPEVLDMSTAIYAALSYILADISRDLPRNDITISNKP